MPRLTLLTALAGVVLAAAPAQAAVTAFRHVNVVPMTSETILPDQTVIVRDGVIEAVGPAARTPIPRGAQVIEGGGRYLAPGLVDFHTHPAGPSELVSFLRGGVTTIAALDGEFLDWARFGPGAPKDLPHPRLLTATSAIDGRAPASPRFRSLGDPADAAAMIERDVAAGADLIKTYGQITLPEFKAVAREARARRVPLVGHTPENVSMADALIDGVDVVAHAEEYLKYLGRNPTPAQYDMAVAVTVRGGAAVIPNLVAYDGILDHSLHLDRVLADPRVKLLPPPVYHSYLLQNNEYGPSWRGDVKRFAAVIEAARPVLTEVTRRLHAAGVPLLAGSDASIMVFPDEAVHREIALLGAAGLSNYEAFRAAGANVSDFLMRTSAKHAGDRFGVVAPGARADLILVDANPLDDLAALKRLQGVMVGGAWRTRAQIDADLDRLAAAMAVRHALVDEYERLHAAKDLPAILAFLDRVPRDGFPLLEDETVMMHADALASAGRPLDAATLLEHAQPLLAHPMGILKIAAGHRRRAGDWDGAERLYRRALELDPQDAQAKDGLRLLAIRREVASR